MFYVNTSNNYKEIYTEEELTKAVHDSIEYYRKRAEELKEENNQLRASADEVVRKDYEDQINSLTTRLALSYGEFSSAKEKNAYFDFENRHMHDRLTSRANGGRTPYLIPTGTGIGTLLTVVCPICGEKENITDMEAW
jgi:regulator of replication initiation timing